MTNTIIKMGSYTINNELVDKIKNLDRDFPVYVKLHRPVYKNTIYGCFLSPTTVVNEGVFKELKLSISHRVIKDNFEELMEFLHNLLKQYKESE